jgi:hypothetical protein
VTLERHVTLHLWCLRTADAAAGEVDGTPCREAAAGAARRKIDFRSELSRNRGE